MGRGAGNQSLAGLWPKQIIVLSVQFKWYQIKAEILNFNINETNHKSVHYLRRYGLKHMASPKEISRFLCFAP